MAQSIETQKCNTLSYWTVTLGWLAMIIFAFHACTHAIAASDTWIALACGRHFLNHGVDTVEPFSANSHKAGPTEEDIKKWPKFAQWLTDKLGLETVKYWHPTGWINQNWLSHVIFYWLTHLSPFADAETLSFNSLVYWKFAIYILTVICVYHIGVTLGVNPALSAVSACSAMFIIRTFLDIRPAGFSNLLVAVFLLILVLTTYRNILYIWLIVPLVVLWGNLHGGYIYAFMMLVPFTVVNLLTSSSKKRFASIGLKGICHTIAAGLVALFAMILFNPFHLTNLTHTFTISLSKHAKLWRTVDEWRPAFDWKNPVGNEIPFLVMFIIACLLLLIWAVVLILTSRSVSRSHKAGADSSDGYQWPQIDVALMIIVALTIYMAIRFRRFIPIAAIAACPIMAMFINQIICAISATRNFHKQNRLFVSPMPYNLQLFSTLAATVAVLTFGTWCGLKFKRVYLDPGCSDPKLNSVFMRMTASNDKPFYACKFIKDNKLEGKMLNYWAEGGFIAWCQQADPNTGRIPLQLFIDGRAQAAYQPKVYKLWAKIMRAGPIAQSARMRKRTSTAVDYEKIAQWIDKQLKKHNVWVVLMPSYHFDKPLVKGLEYNPNWRIVFFNDKQKLLVDITTPQGRELFDGISNGKTLYPDDFSKNLALANTLFLSDDEKTPQKTWLDFAIEAFELNPSPAPMQMIIFAAEYTELRPRVNNFCKDYFNSFTKNKDSYAKQDGYIYRIAAASIAGDYLQKTAKMHKNPKLAESYAVKNQECKNELKQLLKRMRW